MAPTVDNRMDSNPCNDPSAMDVATPTNMGPLGMRASVQECWNRNVESKEKARVLASLTEIGNGTGYCA